MKETARLFNCVLCHELVNICSDCDRGNIYCSERCSTAARQLSMRKAAKRYQSTFQGRLNHAKRQADYRSRQQQNIEDTEKVTHQGSQVDSPNDLLTTVPTAEKIEDLAIAVRQNRCCDFCSRGEFQYFRQGFVRHRVVNKTLIASRWSQGP